MIEPQNTMMPLPADSAPADVPNGEPGFGEMLAQSLGMVPHLDPGAIQQLAQNGGNQQGEDAGNLFAGGRPDNPDTAEPEPITRHVTAPVDASARLPEPIAGTRPPFVDAGFVDPVFNGDLTVPPSVVADADPLAGIVASDPAANDDGIWKPVLTSTPAPVDAETEIANPPTGRPVDNANLPGGAVTAPPTDNETSRSAVVAADPVAVDPPGRREPAPVGPVKPEVPVAGNPPAGDPVAPIAAPNPTDPVSSEPIRSIGPNEPKSKPTVPVGNRSLPTQPAPTNEQADAVGTAPTTVAMPNTATTPVTSARPLTDPTPGNPVRLDQAEIKIDGAKPVSIGDAPVSLDSSRAATSGVPPTSSFDGAPVQAAPVTDLGSPTAPAAPTAHSALAERVLSAVELQANQPPPRTMVVDIPEIEGLRLVVSVRGGAEVHVVQSSASSAVNNLQPFMEELQGVLESRGFVMTGDGRRRNNNPQQDQEPQRPRAGRPTFRRPADNDLRI